MVSSAGEAISFVDHSLDARLRGRSLPHDRVETRSSNPAGSGEVLARCGAVPIWVRREIGQSRVDAVAVPLPELAADELPFEYLRAGNFIRLLPLVHFLREVVGDAGWQAPPLRACFMFDDPNLHALSYGFLPFSDVLHLARIAPFHVTCAMVPLDAWYADRRAAKLFRDNPEHLSLLFHGNDHLRGELASCQAGDGQLRMLAQARRRIERFERRTGLRVARAMAPPHGACHTQIPNALFSLGFHGAFISPWSLQDWGLHRAGTAAFGLEIAEMTPSGLPIAPRFRLSAECDGGAVIAAFLDQPIVPVGHHDTLADGPELLTQVAATINSLGKVVWENPQSILETNYATAITGSCLRLRPYSASFGLQVPDGITSLSIESPMGVELSTNYLVSDQAAKTRNSVSGPEEFGVTRGQRLRFTLDGFGAVDHHRVDRPRFSPWATARRLLCEARDRAWPIADGLRTRKRRSSPRIDAATKVHASSC